MIDLSNMTIKELEEYISSFNEKSFHAKQIFKWIHREKINSIDEMTDISKSLRSKLKDNSYISKLEIIKVLKSVDGTAKFLIKLQDSNVIESVFMKYNHGNSVCVSTQVGCKMGCKFCASTKNGFVRNLTASEIEGQIIAIEEYMKERVSNVVYMGIGEPLDNFDNVIKSINIINNPLGLNIGARHISLSTCGIVDKIYELANLNIQCTLSISLHEVSDDKRSLIMPINKKYNIQELLKACKYYISKTNRRISFEYALINGVNDDVNTALNLAKLLKGIHSHINLIPVNEIKNGEFRKSRNIEKFKDRLIRNGFVATVRRKLGDDINAACGQLKNSYEEGK